MPEVSLVMIVKNAGEQLRNAVLSASEFCNDIIVIDTGSTDNTPQIAMQLGTKLFFKKWNNDFSEARNFALNHALNEWILVLDHDETLNGNSLKSNFNLFQNPNVGGIRVNIRNITDNNNASQLHKYTRIFRNRKDVRFAGKIHEQINQSVIDAGFEIIDSDIEILHYGYNQNNIEKNTRNEEMLKSAIKDNPNDDFSQYQYAKTLFAMENYKEFLEISDKLLNSNELRNSQKELLLVRKAQAYLSTDNYDKILEISDLELTDKDLNGFMKYIRAAAYMQRHEFSEAYKLYHDSDTINSNMTDNSIIESAQKALKKILFS